MMSATVCIQIKRGFMVTLNWQPHYWFSDDSLKQAKESAATLSENFSDADVDIRHWDDFANCWAIADVYRNGERVRHPAIAPFPNNPYDVRFEFPSRTGAAG